MNKAYAIEGDTIVLFRNLTTLDIFVKDFLDILKKHCDYLVVSGFVSIATGRVRGTEDIDILVPTLEKNTFARLFSDLEKKFWCYQGDAQEELHPYIKRMERIRFARIGESIPNIEFIPIDKTRKIQWYEFTHPLRLKIKEFSFNIPPIEFEILYKELMLGADKDLQDARHLRDFFSDIIKEEKFKDYKRIMKR